MPSSHVRAELEMQPRASAATARAAAASGRIHRPGVQIGCCFPHAPRTALAVSWHQRRDAPPALTRLLWGATDLRALSAPRQVSAARVLQQAGNGNALVANTPGAAYAYQAVVPVSYFNNYVGA